MLTVARVAPEEPDRAEKHDGAEGHDGAEPRGLSTLPPAAEHGGRLERRLRSTDGELEVCLFGFPSEAAVEAYDAELRRLPDAAPDDDSRPRLLRLPLVFERGPERIRLWRCVGEWPVYLILDNDETLDEVDLLMVAEVLTDLDRHLDAGLRFAHGALGVADPLREPELVFYADDEWFLRFTEGCADPYGVGVMFRRHEPVRIEDLDEGEIVEWPEAP